MAYADYCFSGNLQGDLRVAGLRTRIWRFGTGLRICGESGPEFFELRA